jgi:signal transduction histidine kinase
MMDNKRLFFTQTVQDTAALYYRLPIRQFDLAFNQEIFSYCKEINFLDLNYESKNEFLFSLEKLLKNLPDFFNENIEKFHLSSNIQPINYIDIETLKEYFTFTRSSFSPFFIRALNDSKLVTTLKIAFHIYILFLNENREKDDFKELFFLNYTYRVYNSNGKLFIFGPVMINQNFDNHGKKLLYIKNIKNFFELQLHSHELVNLINQRSTISIDRFNKKTENMINVLLMAEENYNDSYSYSKSKLREDAKDFITKNIDKEYIEDVDTIIKNNQILRDLEGLEWFNDLTFNYLSFGTSTNKHTNSALDFLQIKLQADAYILCNYDHAQEEILVDECNISNKKLKDKLSKAIKKSNKDGKLIKNSLTYEVISDYLKHNIPIKLVEDMSQSKHKLCNADSNIGSLLSIPLVFDQRVFAVLHFIGYEKFKFDEIDMRFLLKLSSAVSHKRIEKIFSDNIANMVSLLEGLTKTIDHKYLQENTDEICKDIAKSFSSDGAIIWFNKKEVFQRPKETNELTILSQVNFLDDSEVKEKRSYSLSLENGDNLIKQHLYNDITVIHDISLQCTNQENDLLFMKYKKEFERKGIVSIMFVTIKNYEGDFSGAVMLFDKQKRNYNLLSQNMLKKVTLNMGSILNTVTYAKYRAKQLDERNLHESAQYLNIINSRARDLENRLKKLYINNSYEKYRLFLNIEDIKDFTAFTRKYLFTLFKGDSFVVTKYDEVIEEEILEIHKNSRYVSIRNSLNQVLAAQKNMMNLIKDIVYIKNIQYDVSIKIPKQQFHDVLNNVINNAIKYGKIGTQIKIWDELNRPYFYNIYIKNIGYPIEDIERERIFEKGVRGYVTKTKLSDNESFEERASENKGLGLYYVKNIMSKGLKGNVKLHKSSPIGKTGFSENIFVIKIPFKMLKER